MGRYSRVLTPAARNHLAPYIRSQKHVCLILRLNVAKKLLVCWVRYASSTFSLVRDKICSNGCRQIALGPTWASRGSSSFSRLLILCHSLCLTIWIQRMDFCPRHWEVSGEEANNGWKLKPHASGFSSSLPWGEARFPFLQLLGGSEGPTTPHWASHLSLRECVLRG